MPSLDDLRWSSTEALIAREQAKFDAVIAALPWWKRWALRLWLKIRR